MAESDLKYQIVVLQGRQDDLIRRMENVEHDIENKCQTKESSADNLRRVIALEETIKWVTRTILGVVILAVLGTIIVVKKGGL